MPRPVVPVPPWEVDKHRDTLIGAFCERNFAPGWNADRMMHRVEDIARFAYFNSEVIPAAQRSEIARRAKALAAVLEGVGGLSAEFQRDLKNLAKTAPPEPKQGGQKGVRTLPNHVGWMAVRLYYEAHAKPGYSECGPIQRFVDAVTRAVGVQSVDSSTVKAAYNEFKNGKLKDEIRRVRLHEKLYKSIG